MAVYLNLQALLFVLIVNIICFLVFMKKKGPLEVATKLAFIVVFTVTIFYLASILADLRDLTALGPKLSFVILSNAYMGLIKAIELIYIGFKKGKEN